MERSSIERKPGENALDLMARKARGLVSRFDAVVFSGAFALTLVVHLYMFTHKFINHDDVDGLFSDLGFGLSSGRWLLSAVSRLSGSFSSSWINGLLGAFFLALGVLFTVRTLRVRHYASAFLIAAAMVAFPTVASTYAYMFCSYQYLFSLAFAAFAAWCITEGTLPRLAAGAIALALAMGCYQAYFSFAAALVLTVYAFDLCAGRWGGDGKRSFLAGVRYVLALAAGMILYFIVLRLCLAVTGAELVSYQGIDTMGRLTPSELLRRVVSAYLHYFAFYLNRAQIFHNAIFPLSAACMASGLAAAAFSAVKNKLYRRPAVLALLAACIALFPLASALVYVMAGWGIHLVMEYAFVTPLLLPAALADRLTLPRAGAWAKRAALGAAALLLALQLLCDYECFLITNRAYFSMDMTYENVYEYYTKLLTKIELQEGYTKDSWVAMIGTHHMDGAIPDAHMTGVLIGDSALNYYSRWYYLHYFLASAPRMASADAVEAIRGTAEFRSMPTYPDAGSIRTIDGVIVVKLPEEQP